MKKSLISKVAVGVAILLFLVGTTVRPNEACRVPIKGKEEGWANDKPSLFSKSCKRVRSDLLVLGATLRPPTPPTPGPSLVVLWLVHMVTQITFLSSTWLLIANSWSLLKNT